MVPQLMRRHKNGHHIDLSVMRNTRTTTTHEYLSLHTYFLNGNKHVEKNNLFLTGTYEMRILYINKENSS